MLTDVLGNFVEKNGFVKRCSFFYKKL